MWTESSYNWFTSRIENHHVVAEQILARSIHHPDMVCVNVQLYVFMYALLVCSTYARACHIQLLIMTQCSVRTVLRKTIVLETSSPFALERSYRFCLDSYMLVRTSCVSDYFLCLFCTFAVMQEVFNLLPNRKWQTVCWCLCVWVCLFCIYLLSDARMHAYNKDLHMQHLSDIRRHASTCIQHTLAHATHAQEIYECMHISVREDILHLCTYIFWNESVTIYNHICPYSYS